jgi:hypothetical protein
MYTLHVYKNVYNFFYIRLNISINKEVIEDVYEL